MYNKERKVWNFLRKLGKYTFILCGGTSFLCGIFLTGGGAAVFVEEHRIQYDPFYGGDCGNTEGYDRTVSNYKVQNYIRVPVS